LLEILEVVQEETIFRILKTQSRTRWSNRCKSNFAGGPRKKIVQNFVQSRFTKITATASSFSLLIEC
jgi:hypothetical protein